MTAPPNRAQRRAYRVMTGAELRTARKAARMTQADLAKRVGVTRDTIRYWEAKPLIRRFGTGARMAEALGLRINWQSNARAGGWGDSCCVKADAEAEVLFAAYLARTKARQAMCGTRWTWRTAQLSFSAMPTFTQESERRHFAACSK